MPDMDQDVRLEITQQELGDIYKAYTILRTYPMVEENTREAAMYSAFRYLLPLIELLHPDKGI